MHICFLHELSRSFFSIVDSVSLWVDNNKLSAPGLCFNFANLRSSTIKVFMPGYQVCDFDIQVEVITLGSKFNRWIGLSNKF